MDLLAMTLAGTVPATTGGEDETLRWRWLAEGVLEICPQQDVSRAVVLSAGIHGNETAPIELLNLLVNDLLTGAKPLAVRLLVILGNPAAMRVGKRYLTNDMNRLFGGRYQQFPTVEEASRARRLEQIVSEFFTGERAARFHFDLHTAIRESLLPRFGILPFQNRPYSVEMLALLDGAGLDALVIHQAAGGTFSHFSSEQALAASCTLELGKARPFGSNDLRQFAAIDRALRALVCGEPLPARIEAPIRIFRVTRSLLKRSEAFQLHLSEDTANFTELKQGTLLCEQPGETYRVRHEREWVLFPNPHVALGLRAGMMLIEEPRSALF